MDPTRREIGNPTYKVRSRLGRTPLSRFIDCGSTQLGPSADNYDVVLTVVARVQAEGDGASSVHTRVEAMARPATYAQEYSPCGSKGNIEARLSELIRARLAK
jgi:hypothetical protein